MAQELKQFSLNPSDFTLSSEDSINAKTLNPIIDQLINNDLYIYGQYDKIPGYWKCKWYNDQNIEGYSKGDFFWLNTESITTFMQSKWKEIQKYANENPFILSNLPDWKANDEEVYSQYYNVLTGYTDPTKSKPLQALYEIGELSAPVQLVISLADNNKESISNQDYWKKVLVNTDQDYETIIDVIYENISSVMEEHIKDYHFGYEEYNDTLSSKLSLYVNEDFSNISASMPKNFIDNDGESIGFDVVEYFVSKPIPGLSSKVAENTWFRLWKSGYLEHGGIVDIHRYLNYKLSTLVTIPFNWEIVEGDSRVYDVRYLAKDPNTLLKIDESREIPPGDDYISVLYELEHLVVNGSTAAPYYANSNYTVTLTPVEVVDSGIGTESYLGLGDNSIENNVLRSAIELDSVNPVSFSFKYNSKNTPQYYSYYVAGFYAK